MAHEVFKKTVEKWGVSIQVGTAMEECGELIAACNQYFFRDRISAADLASEVADVELVCEQLRSLLGDGIVDEQKEIKLERLIKRVSQ